MTNGPIPTIGSSIGVAAEQERLASFAASTRIPAPRPVEQADLGRADRLGSVHVQVSPQHDECRRPPSGATSSVGSSPLMRRSQTCIGVKVRAGPSRPPNSPAITRTRPLPVRQAHHRYLAVRMPW